MISDHTKCFASNVRKARYFVGVYGRLYMWKVWALLAVLIDILHACMHFESKRVQKLLTLTLLLSWEAWQEMVDFLVECWDQEGLYD